MNCKITQREAERIRYLVNVEKKKLREVAYLYFLSTAQVHRIANGTNWKRVTGSPAQESNSSPEKVNR